MEQWREMTEDTQTRYNLLCMRMRARAEGVYGGLSQSPVTEAQVRAAERRLGFQLPLALHQLFTTIANGGQFFESSGWLGGIADDQYARNPNIHSIEEYPGHGSRLDDATRAALQSHLGAFVILDDLPEGTIWLAGLGGNDMAWLDGPTGEVWFQSEYFDQNNESGIAYGFLAPSVEDWLERELATPPFPEPVDALPPPYPLAAILRPDGQISDATIPAAPVDSFPFSERGKHMQQHLSRLRRNREQVIHALYEIGTTWYAMVREVGAMEAREFGSEEMLQQLARAEAEI
jgi:SMI1 / KNR4 family (SUKH-1)